jgi:PTS system nitrogen regulatory IIA component
MLLVDTMLQNGITPLDASNEAGGLRGISQHMDLGDLLTPEGVIPSLRAKSKKQVLQELSERATELTGLDARNIFDALWHREKLGSTGLGRGVGIPHAKFRGLTGMICLFARLEEPVPFESLDEEPVDLVFALLAPEHASGDHLKALARISRLVRDPQTIARLRAAKDTAALMAVLTDPATSHAA